MKLYNFPRSSASYRVRIACNLKGIEVEKVLVNFREDAQRSPDYLALNPSGLTPALVEEDGFALSQSIAILKYLDHLAPEPRLFPVDPRGEARVMEMVQVIASDIHPLNNLRVLKYLKNVLGVDEDAKNAWYAHWIALGFEGLEQQVRRAGGGPYCFGETLSAADLCLVPQMFNARRFEVPLEAYPKLVEIDARLQLIEAFAQAAPEA
ncbi:MAG: maleylacetoacetate isomerase [Henriciella sp.]|nr:maleylacetoacetate isomerase [Henriciella sp.]